jgi:hypothetical protein
MRYALYYRNNKISLKISPTSTTSVVLHCLKLTFIRFPIIRIHSANGPALSYLTAVGFRHAHCIRPNTLDADVIIATKLREVRPTETPFSGPRARAPSILFKTEQFVIISEWKNKYNDKKKSKYNKNV